MIEKISREVCLIKYREFPLRSFEGDNEICYYPKLKAHYWLKLERKSQTNFSNTLATEITKLFKNLSFENLIFFGDYNRSWISKYTEERNDSKSLLEALNYFKKYKVGNRFKGAIKVNLEELPQFIKHFYTITVCDGGFAYYHFMDEEQNLLGFIHYSGEVQFNTLNDKINKLFLEEITKTKFLDADIENTSRI